MATGPVVIGFDGSASAERAVQEAGELLAPRPALVVVVWEPGAGFELLDTQMVPPAPIDIRLAYEIDQKLYEGAQRLAERGASLARAAGLKAEGLAVADDRSVADTLLRLVSEQDAAALVVGSHGHKAVREVLFGSTTREIMRRAPCPVVMVRAPQGTPPPD
jgi:nucleotide-binding universal stress UspA family protein